MKKILLAVLFLAMFFVTACTAAPTSIAVQLPSALTLALAALILAGTTLGLQVVFDSIGLDLRGLGAAIAVAVSGFAVAQLQGLIDVIPAHLDQLVTIVLNVAVVILGGAGNVAGTIQKKPRCGIIAAHA